MVDVGDGCDCVIIGMIGAASAAVINTKAAAATDQRGDRAGEDEVDFFFRGEEGTAPWVIEPFRLLGGSPAITGGMPSNLSYSEANTLRG